MLVRILKNGQLDFDRFARPAFIGLLRFGDFGELCQVVGEILTKKEARDLPLNWQNWIRPVTLKKDTRILSLLK